MKKQLLIFLLLLRFFTIGAQPSEKPENIRVFTDRTLYISGEYIRFVASVMPPDTRLISSESRVLYCELLSPDGKVIQGNKHAIRNESVSGCIPIPQEAISGYYYLRFYTRLLRNSGPEYFHYQLIKILHPELPDVLSNPGVEVPVDSGWIVPVVPDPGIRLDLGKKKYNPGETIHASVISTENSSEPIRLCVSVIPQGSFNVYRDIPVPTGTSDEFQLLPETKGVSISGKVMERTTGKPVIHAQVNLSIIGDKDMMARYSDSSGRFVFNLPDHPGARDLFISASSSSNPELSVLVDNDFCPLKPVIPSPQFSLDSLETTIALTMIRNRIIAAEYGYENPEPSLAGQESDILPFYGNKCETLVLEQYIDLPTLEDYIRELPVMLRVRKVDGRKTIRFITDKPEMSIFRPLVMIDWLAIDDMESMLAVSPLEIDRVEIINTPYIKGDITFGGIISFISRKRNFAGIDLPKSGTFLNYEFFQPGCKPEPVPARQNLPDFRNTILWDTITLKPGETAGFSMIAASTPGNYEILVRRSLNDGKEVVTREMFQVK